MAAARGTIGIARDRCKGCELCTSVCPKDCIEMSGDTNRRGNPYVQLVRPDDCTGCTLCAVICPDLVIAVYRETRAAR